MKSKFTLISFLIIISLAGIAQIPTKGLVLYLPLNGNANDMSQYKNNGINYGSTAAKNRFGNDNKAMYFNGNSYMLIPSNQAIVLGNNKSISCWVYIPSNVTQNTYPTILHKDEPLWSQTYGLTLLESSGYSSNQYKFDFLFASNYTHYQCYSKQLYTNYKDQWIHIASTYDSISGYSKMYFNGIISDSIYVGNKTAHVSNLGLYIGTGKGASSAQYFKGYLDDIRLYNRAIDKKEVLQLYLENNCTNSERNDTTIYAVSSENFKNNKPIYHYIGTDSLVTKNGGCDSIIHRYGKFEFTAKVCTETKYISVTDTLIINLVTGVTNNTINTIKLYPNPARTNLNVNFGDYTKLVGYMIAIRNNLGSIVYIAPITQTSTLLDIKSWSKGVYLVQIFDSNSNVIDVRKIIIQ